MTGAKNNPCFLNCFCQQFCHNKREKELLYMFVSLSFSQTSRVRERCICTRGITLSINAKVHLGFMGLFLFSVTVASLSLGMVLLLSALRPLYHPAVQLASGWSQLATTVPALTVLLLQGLPTRLPALPLLAQFLGETTLVKLPMTEG